jgi:hypothetical protein
MKTLYIEDGGAVKVEQTLMYDSGECVHVSAVGMSIEYTADIKMSADEARSVARLLNAYADIVELQNTL